MKQVLQRQEHQEPSRKKKILIFTGNYYEADQRKFYYVAGDGKQLVFRVGNKAREEKPYSCYFGRRIKIVGFDIEKEWVFGQPDGLPFAEVWDENLENLVIIESIMDKTIRWSGYKVGRLIETMRQSGLWQALKWNR